MHRTKLQGSSVVLLLGLSSLILPKTDLIQGLDAKQMSQESRCILTKWRFIRGGSSTEGGFNECDPTISGGLWKGLKREGIPNVRPMLSFFREGFNESQRLLVLNCGRCRLGHGPGPKQLDHGICPNGSTRGTGSAMGNTVVLTRRGQ